MALQIPCTREVSREAERAVHPTTSSKTRAFVLELGVIHDYSAATRFCNAYSDQNIA